MPTATRISRDDVARTINDSYVSYQRNEASPRLPHADALPLYDDLNAEGAAKLLFMADVVMAYPSLSREEMALLIYVTGKAWNDGCDWRHGSSSFAASTGAYAEAMMYVAGDVLRAMDAG